MRASSCVVIAISMIAVNAAVVQNVLADEIPATTPADSGSSEAPPAQPPRGRADKSRPGASSDQVFLLRPPELSHKFQTGLSLMPGSGYRVVIPYQENKFCGDASGNPGKRVCTHVLPFFLDLQLSFGASSQMDLMIDLRFGVSVDPASKDSDSHQFAIAPGMRFWVDQEATLKFFTTLQLVFDLTKYPSSQVSSSDFGFRNANGLMYDVTRSLGLFVQLGETIGVARWFRIELDGGVGLQLRVP